MNHIEVTNIISNIINITEDYVVFFWVGTDGIFHNVVMMLFDMEAEKFKSELYKEEEKTVGGKND